MALGARRQQQLSAAGQEAEALRAELHEASERRRAAELAAAEARDGALKAFGSLDGATSEAAKAAAAAHRSQEARCIPTAPGCHWQ